MKIELKNVDWDDIEKAREIFEKLTFFSLMIVGANLAYLFFWSTGTGWSWTMAMINIVGLVFNGLGAYSLIRWRNKKYKGDIKNGKDKGEDTEIPRLKEQEEVIIQKV